ncbi:preprotein translocase subunit SecE [Bdellovibrionota bacterium FG-2]
MENQFQKWVNLSYLAVAVLLGYIVFELSAKLVGMYDFEARVRNIDLIIRITSVVMGGVLFFMLYKNEQVNQFMNEVMVELSRVTWPTQKETSSATLVVIVMVIISGFILGFLDYFWTLLLKWVL